MTAKHPPRIALALLHRFVNDEALTGDLVEQYHASGSRSRFWWQALGAVSRNMWRRPDEATLLRLIDEQSGMYPRQPVRLEEHHRQINLATTPVGAAVGGLGVVALGVFLTMLMPELWWVMGATAVAGVLLGVCLVWIGSRKPRVDSVRLLR
jgi:hypothetical protein